jgi:hypothetical protein
VPSARFTPNNISSYWGSIGRLGELILMLENLRKWPYFHAMGPLMSPYSNSEPSTSGWYCCLVHLYSYYYFSYFSYCYFNFFYF